MNKKSWQIIGRLAVVLPVTIIFILAGHSSATAKASLAGPVDSREVETFIDPLMTDLMAESEAPGGAIALVKDGQLLFAKGYGLADQEHQIPVVADTTLFRAGSVAKLFTWTAVMQLIEQGKVDLDTDINTYLHHFQIPATYPQPITLRHLMTHTAGFEDLEIDGRLVRADGSYEALSDFLAANMPARIFPPGEVMAYSNYGAALAGEIVAEVSGEPFETYIARHILEPLAMTHSTFEQPLPPELAQDAATGYRVDGDGARQAAPFKLMVVRPAAALSSTVTDMAHFMIAHLQNGRYENAQILQPATIQAMQQPAFAFAPQLPGFALGFAEYRRNGLQMLFHPGDLYEFQSLLVLIPEQNMGLYLVLNASGSVTSRLNLLNAVLDHYYPASLGSAAGTVTSPAKIATDITQFTGNYIVSRRAETNSEKLAAALGVASVSANGDNTLKVSAFKDSQGEPLRWQAIEPLLFQEVGGDGLLAFRTDENGHVTTMYNSNQPIVEFHRLTWLTNPQNHLIGFLVALGMFGLTAVAWLAGTIRRFLQRSHTHFQPFARHTNILAGGLIMLNFTIVGLISPALIDVPYSVLYALPTAWLIAGTLVLVSAAGALALLGYTAYFWWFRVGNVWRRLHYTAVTVTALYFVWFFIQANFVIYRF